MIIECFFFIEGTEEDGIVRALCINCKPKYDISTWFYSGQVGPWTIKCHKCNEIIYLHENNYEENPSAF